MKTFLTKPVLLFAVAAAFSLSAPAQVFIKIRPAVPVFVRPVSPSPRHIWVDGDWIWRDGRYQYQNGYWMMPPRAGAVWVPGHWKQTRRGWFWKPGHWRRW